eukprot:CAMPEP_0202729068 /NCGR_PEP_ID=MMETSP1385-20130828/185944_1 /ASSEMBLY_ACC=CAM_ASM_000861 /TAXON_ID=933848 /ORGANISM="Elphidium margaritaceum" /LENGTH=357 /DNA_ID=CAMNT_0049395325 /DNA_START=1343 /DNA_END=2416 /DNA_ORIENTATION=-
MHGMNKTNEVIFKDEGFKAAREWSNWLVKKVNKGKIRGIVSDNIKTERIKLRLLKKERKQGGDFYAMNAGMLQSAAVVKAKESEESVGYPDPGSTREWNNQIKMLSFALDNKAALEMLSEQQNEHKDYIADELLEHIDDDDMWQSVQQKHEKLLPISTALKSLQSGDSNLADAAYQFLFEIPSFYSGDDDEELFKGALQYGYDLCHTQMYDACLAVDPRYRDEKLSMNTLLNAEIYFKFVLRGSDAWNKVKHIFNWYRTKRGPFGHDIFDMNKSQTKYDARMAWNYVRSAFDDDPLAALFFDEVEYLLVTPPGITDAEKTFCSYRRYHDWKRSNLGRSKLKKMIKVKINWGLRNKVF